MHAEFYHYLDTDNKNYIIKAKSGHLKNTFWAPFLTYGSVKSDSSSSK